MCIYHLTPRLALHRPRHLQTSRLYLETLCCLPGSFSSVETLPTIFHPPTNLRSDR